jgi:FkbM family methyltransferase
MKPAIITIVIVVVAAAVILAACSIPTAVAVIDPRNSFLYPNGRSVAVTDGTLDVNRFTWEGFQGKVYESDSIKYVYDKLAGPGRRTLLDIGAQSGLYALYAKHFTGIRVDAYEPFPPSYKCLVDNIALNGAGHCVFPFNIAVSDTRSTTVMRCPPDHTGLNTLGKTPLRFDRWVDVEVATDTIDNLYANRRVDFVKCDTEGWEYFVLKGGRRVLRRDKPELLLEVNETTMRQCGVSREQLMAELDDLGYRYITTINEENMAFSARPAS